MFCMFDDNDAVALPRRARVCITVLKQHIMRRANEHKRAGARVPT